MCFCRSFGPSRCPTRYANEIYEFLFEIICLHYVPCPTFLIHTSTYQSTNIDICNPSKLYDAYICLRKLCYQCLAQWCLININWTLQNKFQWNWNKTITSYFKKNIEKISQHLISASVGKYIVVEIKWPTFWQTVLSNAFLLDEKRT